MTAAHHYHPTIDPSFTFSTKQVRGLQTVQWCHSTLLGGHDVRIDTIAVRWPTANKIVVDQQQQQERWCNTNRTTTRSPTWVKDCLLTQHRDVYVTMIPQRSLDRPHTVATRRGGVSRPCVCRTLARLCLVSTTWEEA